MNPPPSTLPSPAYRSDLRVVPGRFCQLNCLQEALLPVLREHHGCDPEHFGLLRMVTWAQIGAALSGGRPAGLAGGLAWTEMTRLYEIEWLVAPPSGSLPETVRRLAAAGPPLIKVDRFHVPADRLWHGRAHLPHTVLVVGADAGGIAYSDAEYAQSPAELSWAELRAAVLREPDGELTFARSVTAARDLNGPRLAAVESAFLTDLTATLRTPAGELDRLVSAMTDRLRACSDGSRAAEAGAVDIGAYLNAMAHGLAAGADLAERRGVAPESVDTLRRTVRAVDLCVTRALSYADTFRPRHLERFEQSARTLVTNWPATTALADHLSRGDNCAD